jgi:23S rRNA pseudouridine1911/1915/1917 synthase
VPFGVRVVIADDFRAAVARRLVRGQQGHGVDLEAAGAILRDIAGGAHPVDAVALPQQQPAALFGSCLCGFFAQCCHHATCHFDGHAHFPTMSGGESIIEGALGPEQAGQRIDKALAEASGLSRQRVQALMGEGRVTLGGKAASQTSLKVAGGELWTIAVPEAAPAQAQAQHIPLSIVFEDEHLIVVDKPAGLVVHPAAGNPDGTLVNALLHHCKGHLSGIGGVARPGIVHRIDKDTSGLLVVAKTDKAHEGLAAQFAEHSIERRYLAVVAGHPAPPAGKVTGAIARSTRDRTKMALVEDGRGKHAVTHYKTIKLLGHAALVECRLETGRTHQVRVHMSSIGHPLLGDPVYGRASPRFRPALSAANFSRQALHAAELGFVHPVTLERTRFVSEMPADMVALIDAIDH